MGIDIYSGRGVVFTVDEFLTKVINGKNKRDAVSVCLEYHQQIVVDARQNPDDDWRNNLAKSFKPLGGLKKSMKLDEIREIIASTVELGGEVAKYGECWVENAEYVQELFEQILEVCPEAEDVPHIQEVTAWGSGRNNGWEVPKGVACVVFDSESCFERRMNHHGEALKKVLGHCDETEWTEMSY
jgi:hypothetical protein